MRQQDQPNLILEKELLSKIAVRDEHAFSVIYKAHYKKVYNFALRLLRSKQLAEEVMQESFLKIWLQGDTLNSVNNIEAYLVTLSRNKSLDILRQQQRESKLDLGYSKRWVEGHNDTEEAVLLNDARSLLRAAIDQLPPQQKLVYQLCHEDGLKYAEVAEKLNISPLTVKTHMQHALRFLRKFMGNNGDIAVILFLLRIL